MDVLVLEARNRVGGRTLTKIVNENSKNDTKPFWVDLGGSYVGPTQDSVLSLIDELNLKTYLVDDSTNMGYMKVDGRNRIVRKCTFSPNEDIRFGNIIHWLDYVNMVKLIDSYGEQIPAKEPWRAPRAKEWDSKTFKQFVDENTWTWRVADYFKRIYVTVDVCAEASEVSMLWFLWYIKQCGGYGRSIATTNGGQERKIMNGTQQLSIRLREVVGPSKVLLNKPVCRIDQSLGPFVQVQTLDNSTYRSDYLICALPPHLLLKIHHEPALPPGKNLLCQRCPMGQVAKVILYYERPFWKEHNYSGSFLIDPISRASHPIVLSLDETKPDGSHPAVIGFAAADGWYEMRHKSNIEVAKIVAESYAQLTGLEEFRHFIRVERFDWTTEQYSGGCYTSTMTINTLTKYGQHLREPFGRIYYAGTETAIKWSGYMDGAISAGKRAAREILHLIGKLQSEEDIWKAEPESKTVPPKPFIYPTSHRYAPNLSQVFNSLHLLVAIGCVAAVGYRQIKFSKW